MTAPTLSEMERHERSKMITLWRKHEPRPSEVAQRLPVFSRRVESLLCYHLAMFKFRGCYHFLQFGICVPLTLPKQYN
jgi:hypothetical protein